MKASRGVVVALLGAESTGKTTLATELVAALVGEGHDAVMVAEYLREFCDNAHRTPRVDEQAAIADTQTERIEAAAQVHAVVVADTTALMTAVYSDLVFTDHGLYASAGRAHVRGCDLTLLTALDLPWRADGLQRDGPHVREPVDARVRAALDDLGAPYAVVMGQGAARCEAALASVRRALAPRADADADADAGAAEPRWHWHCERCGDPDCERPRRRRLPLPLPSPFPLP